MRHPLLSALSHLNRRFPDFRRDLQDVSDRVRWRLSRTPETDRQLILSAIDIGCFTLADLLEELELSEAEIKSHLDAMLQDGLLERRTEGRRGTTQKGHRTFIYVRPGTPVGSDYDDGMGRRMAKAASARG
jgi:hypothetical protein